MLFFFFTLIKIRGKEFLELCVGIGKYAMDTEKALNICNLKNF